MNAMRPAPYSYRNDASVPDFPDDRPIFVFDGKCVLCSRAARLVLRRDRRRRMRLLPAQTPPGRALYVHYGLDPVHYASNILLADGIAWLKSESSIRIFELLGPPWSLAAVMRVLPLRLRDRLYDVVARNRFLLFGARESCFMAAPGDEDRFLG